MKLFSLFISLNLIASFYMSAQQVSDKKELFDDGEFFFWREDYEEAVYYYLQILKFNPDNANINFKAGECYLNTPNRETEAIPYFKKAVKDITPKYRKKAIDEKQAPLHAYFYLGNAYRIDNQLDKALEAYDSFINHPFYYGNYNIGIVEEEIQAVERAKLIKDDPIKIVSRNLGNAINNSSKNFNPAVSGDEKHLVYSTSLKFYDGIFYSQKIGDKWTDPININPQILSDGNLYPVSLSFNGDILILVNKAEYDDDLYYSKRNGNTWSAAVPFSSNINTKKNETHGCFNKEGNLLYFASDKFGGEGGLDIYVSEKNNAGEWEKPVNLGSAVNTEGDEDCPFILPDGNTLVFASNRHYNMGGFDIFVSSKAESSWTKPINIGFPINTTGDNKFFCAMFDGSVGYMSQISEYGFGSEDIYKVEILERQKSYNATREIIQNQAVRIDNKAKLVLIQEYTGDTLGIIQIDSDNKLLEFKNYNSSFNFQLQKP